MLVYRVEYPKTGLGPYRRNPTRHGSQIWHNLESMVEAHCDDINYHPTPQNDTLGYITSEEVCCFTDIRDLANWFKGYFSVLSRAGYRLVTYRVVREDVREGWYQAVFDLEMSQRIDSKPLTGVYKYATL